MSSNAKKSADRDTMSTRTARDGDRKLKKSKTIVDHELLVQGCTSTPVKRVIDEVDLNSPLTTKD